jgi:hypothetical protein
VDSFAVVVVWRDIRRALVCYGAVVCGDVVAPLSAKKKIFGGKTKGSGMARISFFFGGGESITVVEERTHCIFVFQRLRRHCADISPASPTPR